MNRYLRLMPAVLLIAFAFALIFTVGCSNDVTPPDNGQPSKLEVSGIICKPLAPPPDAIANLTLRVDGQGPAGMYQWNAEAGRLMPDTIRDSEGKIVRIDSTSIGIRWKVPTEAGVYMVTVRASAGSVVSADTTWVMVRRCEAINAGLKYAFYPNLIDGELYAVGTNTNSADRGFFGYHAYKLDIPPTKIDTVAGMTINGSYDFKFYPDGVLASSVTDGNVNIRLQRMNVISFPYFLGLAPKFWSNNEALGQPVRRNQNRYPSTTSDLGMAVWQRTVAGVTDDGRKDLVNIRFRFSDAPSTPIQTLTIAKDSLFQFGAWNYTYWRNIKPMFSPDKDMIIYFNDSTETFEPCLIPLDGSEPNLAEQRALMADPFHGIFFYADVKVSEKTIFQWNPANSKQLAFIDDKRQFCIFDYAAATVEIRATGLTEFVYSEDGSLLAMVADDGVYILGPGQTQAKRVFTKERVTDGLIGINWSPGLDDLKLGFRMVRKGASTLESYSALVIYSVSDGRWYYASPAINPIITTEPEVNYIWMRALFDPLTGGMYIPVPILDPITKVSKTVIYNSY